MTKISLEDKTLWLEKNHALFSIDTNEWKVIVGEKQYFWNHARKIQIEQTEHELWITYDGIVEGLSFIVHLVCEGDIVHFYLQSKEDRFVFDELIFPGTIQTEDGKLVLPLQQGCLLDTKENISFKPGFGGYFGCSDAYVNALGFYSEQKSYLWYVKDYYDSGYQIVNGNTSQICMRTFSSMAHLSYERELDLYLYDSLFDYNAMAHCVRKIYEQDGLLTLKDKVKEKPVLEHLIGGCVYHTGIHSRISKDSRYYHEEGKNEAIVSISSIQKQLKVFHEKGISNIHLHLDGCGIAYDNQHPRFYPIDERTGGYPALRSLIETMHEDGDLLTIHDNYHDIYLDSPDFKESYQIYDRNQKPYFMSVWAGGKQSYLTGQLAPLFLKRNQAYLEEQGVYSDGVYCDVFTCNPFDENFLEEYWMNRKDCANYRNETFDVLNQKKMIVSSEEVNGFAINHIDTCHYAPYPFMMKEDGKQIGQPIPFFNLCFHDCLIIPWMSNIVNGINYGLYGLLNGGIAYLKRDGAYVNTDGSFSQDEVDEDRIAMVEVIASFHKKVAYAKMLEHTFVQDDPMIQKCTYDNGMYVTINLHDNTYSFGCVSNESNL